MDMTCPDQQDAEYESLVATPSGGEDELGTRKRLGISRLAVSRKHNQAL